MELVTGHGASEHITAAQVSRLIQGVTVMDDTTVYRLNVGNNCAIGVNGLTVGISTGEMVLHGYHTTFEDAETLTLDPTLDAAKSRIDKLCLIISEDLTTGIQSAYIQVVQGTESTTPTAPATPSTPTSPTELYMGVGVIATVTVSDTVIASYVDNTDLYAGSFVTKTEFDTNIANIAPIEATSTASKAYAVGNQLIYNGLLYKVDSAIAQGATLTPGGNISLSPDVEAQIASLRSSLAEKVSFSSNISGVTNIELFAIYGTGSAIAGQTNYLGTLNIPSGKTLLNAIFAPNANLPIVITSPGSNKEVYAYSVSYTGEFSYIAVCMLY